MIYVEDIKGIFKEIRGLIEDNKDFLCQLDGSLGDGDIGITLSKGFAAIDTTSLDYRENDIGTLLLSYGMVMAEKAPSTMGTLLASAFLKTGKQFKGQDHLTLNDLVTFLDTMAQGIKERGKAELGDKTVLDSLIPACETLKISAENNDSFQQAFENAYKSADEGMKNTINMKSRKGRAARYLDDSIGKQDPGATVGALFIKGILNYVSKNQTKLNTAGAKG